MTTKKFVACDPVRGEFLFCDTLEEAKAFLEEQDFSDGVPEEYKNGEAWVAKITHISNLVSTKDKKPIKIIPIDGMLE